MKGNPVTPPSTSGGLKRKRGGQPGNTNAVKHGFYSSSFRQLENEALSEILVGNFEDESALIRVVMKRTLDELSKREQVSLDESLSTLRTISFAAAVLERLHRSKIVALGNFQVGSNEAKHAGD